MIIRGNTVSTTIAPEVIADKLGGVGGGIAPIVVNLVLTDKDENGWYGDTSHTAIEIFNFKESGRDVYGFFGDAFVPLTFSNTTVATFGDTLEVRDSKIFRVLEPKYATTEQIGDISSALDEIREYAESLINGGGSV